MCCPSSVFNSETGLHSETVLLLTHSAHCCNGAVLLRCRPRRNKPLASLLLLCREMPDCQEEGEDLWLASCLLCCCGCMCCSACLVAHEVFCPARLLSCCRGPD